MSISDAEPARAHTPPRYYLVAPAGLPNYGDELIAAGWLRYLAETAPEAEVWLDTHSPGPCSVLLGHLHPRVRCTDTLWRLCQHAPDEDPWAVSAWVQEVVHNPGMMAHTHYGVELLASADVVHLLGGGYVNKLWPNHIGLLAGAAAATRRSGGRAAMTGHGLTPVFPHVEPLLRALADRCEVVDVRDDASAELLGVSRGVDDAFLDLGAHRYAEAAPDDEFPDVMLCLQSDLVAGGAAQLAGMVLSTLRAWKVPPEKVGVIEGIPRVDREVYSLFEQELPGARFYPFPDVWDLGLPVSAGQTWISTRFHPHMVAAAGGASGVALSVRPDYYATKHRSLAELGSGWTVVEDLERVPERPVGGGFPAGLLDELKQAKRRLAEAIYAPVPRADVAVEPGALPGPTEPDSPARRLARRFRG